MPLCSKIQVAMPDKGVTIRRTGPYHTVFKRLRSYRNANGVPCSDRVIIGKMDPETGNLIPNNNYYAHYPVEDGAFLMKPEYSTCRSVGAAYLFDRVSRQLGLAEMLRGLLGERRSSLAMTAALHMVARDNVFENVLDYCGGYTLSEAPLTSRAASELFASITSAERMAFFKSWVARQPPGPHLAYDSTSFSGYAKGFFKRGPGFDNDGDRLPQINFGCYFAQATGLPVFYVAYPGPIVDKSRLPLMTAYNEDLGIKDVVFVLEKGYGSTANVRHMDEAGYGFVMEADLTGQTTRRAVEALRDNLASLRFKVAKGVYGRSARGRFYGAASTLHVYYEPGLAEDQRRDLDRLVESKEERLAQLGGLTRGEAAAYGRYFVINLEKDGSFTYGRDHDKLEALSDNLGYFGLLTNTKLDSAELLEAYRRKDLIEKGFDNLKNHLDLRGLGTRNDDTTEGKMFCAFIALIVASHIVVKLGDYMRKNSWSQDRVMAEMEKIRIIAGGAGHRLADPLTQRQRLILEPFGLNLEDLEAYVKYNLS